MRLIVVLFAGMLSIVASDAQARRQFPAQELKKARQLRVDRAEILEAGIYRAQARTAQQNRNSPTGGIRALATVALVKSTATILPERGLHFGIRYVLRGVPRGARVPIRIVQRYPKAGLRNPHTNKTTYVYQQSSFKAIGYPSFEGYHLGSDWELVPGIWRFEIWYKGRKLAEQAFELKAPE